MRLILFVCFLFLNIFCQAQDSLNITPASGGSSDTVIVQQQTVIQLQLPPFDSCKQEVLKKLHLNIFSQAQVFNEEKKTDRNKDWLFYYTLGLLLIFGLLRLSYPRYFKDLFRFFFRTSLRINQIREQLVQSGQQSLFYNIFFGLSFGLYVYLLSNYYHVATELDAWMIPVVAAAALLLLYAGKYFFMRLSGWLFNISTATETYTFIVFLINKVAGIAILPFIVLIAFAPHEVVTVSLTLSFILVGGLFLYRFLRAYQPVQAEVKVSRIHFMIYFLAVEIAPLLLIYKLLIRFM